MAANIPLYVALFFLISSVLVADFKGFRRWGALEPQLKHHGTALDKLNVEVTTINRGINTIESEVHEQDYRVSKLEPAVEEHAAALGRLDSRVSTLEPAVEEHAAALGRLDSRVGILEPEVHEQNRRIKRLEPAVEEHDAALGRLNSRVRTLEPEVQGHAAAIEELHSAANKLKLLYNELRLLIGEWDMTSENPAVGIFHTSEVRRMDRSDGHSSKMILFTKPYRERPSIPVGLMWLDIANNNNIRVKCYSNNIKEPFFEMNIDTWSGTQLYQASCGWMEIEDSHLGFQSGTYDTAEDHSWRDPRMTNERKIVFPNRYTVRPQVVVWLSSFDMRRDRNWRVRAYATDITEAGFTIHIDTWGDSVLYGASASWVSYISDTKGVSSGSISTSGSQSAEVSTNGYTEFSRGVFDFPPRTILGINSLDIDCDRNLRLAVGTTSVRADGMTWYMNSWGDTKLYSASASYIALS